MQNDISQHTGPRLAIEAIGTSAWQAIQRLNQSHLASLHLILANLEFKALSSSCDCGTADSVFVQLAQVSQEDADLMAKDLRRFALLASVGILDSFLSDSLRFIFLYRPASMPSNVKEKRDHGEAEVDYVERIVRRSHRFSSQKKRIEFIASEFSVELSEDLLADLSALTQLRNELAHHPGFYRFNKNEETGDLWAQPKPLPEVSEVDANKIRVVVAELCDMLLVAMCRTLFSDDPSVRLLTPAVAEVHQRFREDWASKRAAAPEVEDVENTRWSARQLNSEGSPWVEDHTNSFMIMPTGIAELPALVSFRRNKLHGTAASISIDGGKEEEIGSSKEYFSKMMTGELVLVKYYENSIHEPQYMRFSLKGFTAAWEVACKMKERLESA